MIMQFVRLRTGLPGDAALSLARERAARFREVPGLVQKYYVRGATPESFVGVYLWDSEASLAAFRDSDLAKSIASAYKVVEPPVVEIGDVVFTLREP
jgi:heme-degrading monooxygenase HmoA